MKSNISSDMNKPCWKLAKACPQSQILFCSRENNLPIILFLPKFSILFEMMMYDSIGYAPDITFNFPTTHTHILYTVGNTEVPAHPTARDQMMLLVRNFYLYTMGAHACPTQC